MIRGVLDLAPANELKNDLPDAVEIRRFVARTLRSIARQRIRQHDLRVVHLLARADKDVRRLNLPVRTTAGPLDVERAPRHRRNDVVEPLLAQRYTAFEQFINTAWVKLRCVPGAVPIAARVEDRRNVTGGSRCLLLNL